ncbi:MAG: ArsR family transcriptional regulator [Clostridia bacterium]|nr:ArsR family transcriptional regulator [Clostridia bacterium]
MNILSLLREKGSLNFSEIAQALSLTNGNITKHLNKLLEAKLISVKLRNTSRGIEKICTLAEEKILIDLFPEEIYEHTYEFELNAGQYSDCEIQPTCGLANTKELIGDFDEPKYFTAPARFSAGILWFTSGWVEYKFPNPVKMGETIKEIQFSVEVSSESPGAVTHYPSDISFSLNGKHLCTFVSPGEFRDRRGIVSPKWWYPEFAQYGRLKIISIDKKCNYLDGNVAGDVTLEEVLKENPETLTFRICVPPDAKNVGGVNIFGKGFGDFNSGIKLRVFV